MTAVEPQLGVRFRQLDTFYRPGSHCDIFDSAMKLCIADLEGWGFKVTPVSVTGPDGRVLWPK